MIFALHFISTHAPLAGRDSIVKFNNRFHVNFNPRAPCGARPVTTHSKVAALLISTHAPLAGRDCRLTPYRSCIAMISTHAPLAGRDSARRLEGQHRRNFNPRAPCGARRAACCGERCEKIFQPTRPLRGATHAEHARRLMVVISTHAPLAGRDCDADDLFEDCRISTHAPLAGRDRKEGAYGKAKKDFNPRAPCGARPVSGSFTASP